MHLPIARIQTQQHLDASRSGKIAALKYASDLCQLRRGQRWHSTAYKAACNDLQIFFEAAISRLESGENMGSVAIAQRIDTV